MNRLHKSIVLFAVTLLTINTADASLRTDINEAKNLYEQEQYDEALKKFMDTEIENPGEPILDYNIGNTFYKQNRYDEAIEHYEKVLLNANNQLSFQANYNIGNCMYNKAIQTESTGKLDESIEEMRQGLDYYKSALSKNPDDIDTKFNTEFLQKEIKRLLDKMNQQQKDQKDKKGQQKDQQQSDQQQKSQKAQKQDKQDKGDKDQDKKEKQQSAEKENDGQDQQQAQKQDDQSDKDEKKQGKKSEQKKEQELTEKEAERLLKNMPDMDKKRKTQKNNRGYLGEVEKDW